MHAFFKNPLSVTRPPFWFMRQAGRYLPEYREIRQSLPDFLSLCYHPEKAAEVTLQPLWRFDMDAAIIFSDILVIPDALGIPVRFSEGEGPLLGTPDELPDFSRFSPGKLAPVYAAISQVRSAVPKEKSLIGFAGAPWTLACYIAEGKGGGEFAKAREMLYAQPQRMQALLYTLEQAVTAHLIAQVEAGADVVQLFDSWAGTAPEAHLDAVIIEPVRRIVQGVKNRFPEIPVIAFPRGLRYRQGEYAARTGIDGFSVETAFSMEEAKKRLPPGCVLQGNLDPILLATSREQTLQRARALLESMRGTPFIFNLGHGIVPQTPVENVAALAKLIREFS